MKRGLLVAALVLVPFALLVALGFHFSERAETPSPREAGERAGVRGLAPSKAAGAPDAGIEVPTEPPIARESVPPLLAPFTPQLRQCFVDNATHGSIRLRFAPQRDGGFSAISVGSNSSQSPYVAACAQDVLEGARFEPSPGPDYAPVDITFSF